MSLLTTLDSEVPIPPDDGRTCWYCETPAVAYWPGNSDKPVPLCQKHLDACKIRLRIAVGGQGELHMQWPKHK